MSKTIATAEIKHLDVRAVAEPRYQLQTRDAWAGRPGGTWLPATAGTANQTGLSDDEASTFASEADAEEAAAALEAEGLTEWRVVEL